MKSSGKNFIVAFILVCHVLLFATLLFSYLRIVFQAHQQYGKAKASTEVLTDKAAPENTSAWNIRQACRRPNLRILYFVHTAPKNADKRRILRRTIGDPKIASEMNSAIAFLVGEAPDLNDHEAVLGEALREGDIVLLNFTDTYKNLTYKFLHGAKWVSDNCLLEPTAAVVKLDDDVVVNLFALSAYLHSGVMALTGIHCQVWTGAAPFRTRKSKWYVSRKDYGSKVYPPYCAGAAFIMQPSVLFALYEASSHVPYLWVDDVYITGWYGTSSAEMERIWQTFKEYNRTVMHDFNRNVHAYYRSVG
ncbi:hypothetical protein MTO96_040532 [Rhipicephalus appendiculatus]